MWPVDPAKVTENATLREQSLGGFFILARTFKSDQPQPIESRLKLSDIQVRLPQAGRRWAAEMSSAERHGTEIILNNVGAESFLKYWKEYGDELQEIRNF